MKDYLTGFVQLHRLRNVDERNAMWRQSMATLAAAVGGRLRTVPLEGFDPEALRACARVAMDEHLVDDLSWLSAPAAAAALYELAAALPPGEEKRELGRRVVQRLHAGDAATFVALATQLAVGSRRALSGPAIKARIALSLQLPLRSTARVDGLALVLISRRELRRDWLIRPAAGSLPSRCAAARLLERAAREAVRRASEGDDGAVPMFNTQSIQETWQRLLSDREPLVWRHVATARGLLSNLIPSFGTEVLRNLERNLTVTEWRRAAASLAASISVDPARYLPRAQQFLKSEVVKRDPGVATALLYGLSPVAETEPEAAENLLDQIVKVGGTPTYEAMVEFFREQSENEVGVWSGKIARAQLREMIETNPLRDDGEVALMEAIYEELLPAEEQTQPSLRAQLAAAIHAFAEKGAREAYGLGQTIIRSAEGKTRELEQCDLSTSEGRRKAFQVLRELDICLFQSEALGNLLALGARDESDSTSRPLGDLFERINQWLCRTEGEVVRHGTVDHLTYRMRTLRTLLHLTDADGTYGDDREGPLRVRQLRATRLLLHRAQNDAPSPLRRTLCAATARVLDALVREEFVEPTDVLFAVGTYLPLDSDIETIAEAAMLPEIESAVRAYAGLQRMMGEVTQTRRRLRTCLDLLRHLSHELPIARTPRVEALRVTLLDLSHALERVAGAISLQELSEGGQDSSLPALEASVQSLALLTSGARRRLGEAMGHEIPASGPTLRIIDVSVDRALISTDDTLEDAIASASNTLLSELPRAIALLVIHVLERILVLPKEAERKHKSSFPPQTKEAPVPLWLPPGRTLGGFYVVKPLSAGAGGSVFVARRLEERNNSEAEHFALKVPEYDGAAARTLSEAEFLSMFRQEAGALLSVPHHSNLARFVTFDAGAQPKPILVMELVEGPTLQRLLEMGTLDLPRAFSLLDGIAAGLEAMHAVGVGHLDVKPSNVILRESKNKANEAVLVDFGLAGRKVRPGCATTEYGAPEVWGLNRGNGESGPMAADVYAFGCLAYEVLTRITLFQAANEVATIAAHLNHDGQPQGIRNLLDNRHTASIGELLRTLLRREPSARIEVKAARKQLQTLSTHLNGLTWPIQID